MKLYVHPASPNARATRIAARLLQLPVEECVVDAAHGEQRSPGYLALNPNGLFPVLVDGDYVLWETAAILHYLAEHAEDGSLRPASARERAEILRWQSWSLAHWFPAVRVYIYENLFRALKGEGEPDLQRVADNEPVFHAQARVLEARLAASPWLAGERLSLADLSVGVHLMYGQAARMPLGGYPALNAWFERLSALPAWQATAS